MIACGFEFDFEIVFGLQDARVSSVELREFAESAAQKAYAPAKATPDSDEQSRQVRSLNLSEIRKEAFPMFLR